MNPMPLVVRAEHRGDYRSNVVFSDGIEKTMDFSAWLVGPVFDAVKDPAMFPRFFLDGGTVAWPNGADIAPETTYEKATKAAAA